MLTHLPTSIFAEWVDRGVGEWMDKIKVPFVEVIDLTDDTIIPKKSSTIEVEIALLQLVYGLPDEAVRIITNNVFCNRLPPPPPYNKLSVRNLWYLLRDKPRKASALRVRKELCGEHYGGWKYFKTTHVNLGYKAKRTELLDTMVYLLLNTGELYIQDYDKGKDEEYKKTYTKPYKKLSCKTITDLKYEHQYGCRRN